MKSVTIAAVRWERILVDPELVRLSIIVLVALSIGGVVYVVAMPFLSDERKTSKRLASISQGQMRSGGQSNASESVNMRKKQVQDTLKDLESKQKSKKKVTLNGRLALAGLNVPVSSFWIASVLCALGIGAAVYITGSSPIVSGLAMVAGGLGFPRWLLGFLAKRRQKKFLLEFVNALDVIVRGVKSGLPLNDCLRIISEEMAEPVKSEFIEVCEQQSIGVPLSKAFDRMHDRMPLQELNFFAIVIAIQQQTGGNLSEALENLSKVLRDRMRLTAKVQAFSAEAKASAAIIGSLPLLVMLALSIMTPDYTSLLWTVPIGKMMLMGSGLLMTCGVLIMRKMINFDY